MPEITSDGFRPISNMSDISCVIGFKLFLLIAINGPVLESCRSVGTPLKGANPQSVSTEIIIEVKQFNPGRMASHASIESIQCTH